MSIHKAGLLLLKACVYWEKMEAGGGEQLVPGPVIKARARLQQDIQKKARKGSLVLGSDFMSIASQYLDIFPVEEQRAE